MHQIQEAIKPVIFIWEYISGMKIDGLSFNGDYIWRFYINIISVYLECKLFFMLCKSQQFWRKLYNFTLILLSDDFSNHSFSDFYQGQSMSTDCGSHRLSDLWSSEGDFLTPCLHTDKSDFLLLVLCLQYFTDLKTNFLHEKQLESFYSKYTEKH